MELRHLRYFVAVAEEGSITNAAERRLFTAQPSLSRQIRELEMEVGVKLLDRKARGITLTAAGRVFLDHARLALLQVDTAAEAARLAEKPSRAVFVIGFLIGQEVAWLPETMRILREEAADIEVMVVSQSSPELASALMRGKLDLAFLRHEALTTGITFRSLVHEPPGRPVAGRSSFGEAQGDSAAGARAGNLHQPRPDGTGAQGRHR